MKSIRLVSNPTLEQSFTSSMEIARDFSAKLEEDAHCAAARLRDEYRREGRPEPGPALADLLARVSAETHADFTAVYSAAGSSWVLRQACPEGFARLDAETRFTRVSPVPADSARAGSTTEQPAGVADLAADLAAAAAIVSGLALPDSAAASRVPMSDLDVVAAGIADDGILFVAGYAMDRGFTDKMHRTADDLGRYRAVGLYERVMRRYIIIATSVLVVLVALGSALIARLIAKRISLPITELARATDRVAKGDLDHRVTVAARDEVASLVAGFNRMTQELQENKRNLIRAERIAAWRDVARRIAHEIKNPLTPIEIAIYRIKKRLEAQAPQAETDRATGDRRVIEESLDSILNEVGALKTIAQEFSSFAKMPEPKMQSVDIGSILKSVLELYASSSQQVEIATDLKRALPPVKADPDQMRSVFSNLVKNAFEAMPSGGTLTVTATASAVAEGRVRVEIADTGAGIPEEIREKVFDPYFTTKPSGTGVGLALAYRILADHQAKISFETGPTGTTFIVDLPAGPGPEAQA